MNTAESSTDHGQAPDARARRVRLVRILAVVGALLPWSIIVLPLWVMRASDDASSFGLPFGDPTSAGAPGMVLSVVVLGFALLVGAFSFGGTPRWPWAIVAAVAALALVGLTLSFAGTTILWDGVDEQGRPTGGMLRAEPGPGMVPVGASVACLGAAAVLSALTPRRARPA